MKLKFIIPGEVISKKNGQKIIRCGRFPKIKAGDAYLKWEKQAIQELQYRRVKWEGSYPVYLKVLFFRKTRRAFDFSNMLESVQDCLINAGVIAEDDCFHIHPVIEGAKLDKNYPRVNVTLKQITDFPPHII